MARNYSNIAFDTTLTAGITAGDLTCVVASATGWPSVPFAAVLDPGSLTVEEVVQVTNVVGTTFTITRGFDGTTAAAHANGVTVRHAAIAGDFTDLQAADATNTAAITAEATTRGNADTAEANTRSAADALLTPIARTLTINGVVFDLSANRSWTVSGGVSSVTASAPLASSGGATPDISLSGTVPSANGGTGVNNAGTLTNATNTTITGGGTLALGGFTATIPATLTAAGLGIANAFTAAQSISLDDSATSAVSTLLTLAHSSSGTPAPNFGTRLLFNLESDTTLSRNAAAIDVYWSTATDASRASAFSLKLLNSSQALAEVLLVTHISSLTQVSAANPISGKAFNLRAASGGTSTWNFESASGEFFIYSPTFAKTPIEVYDTGKVAFNSEFNGAPTGQVGIEANDTSTATVLTALELSHRTTATPAAGFGVRQAFLLKSSTTARQDAANIETSWVIATHASRTARVKLNVYDTAVREVLRGEADGANPMIGFLGSAATARVAITGSRGANAALASLLTELASKGLITDSTSV